MKEYILKPSSIHHSPKVPLSLDGLNPAQRQAVLWVDGPALLIAGAGSGKTNTLVHRVAHLINLGHSPESILLLTFTKRSAQEMLRRASHILDNRCEKVSGGTFHSFSNVVLRHYSDYLGYTPGFTILDRLDADELIGMIRSEHGQSKADKRFPKKSTIGAIFSMSVNTGKSLKEVLMSDYPQFNDYDDVLSEIYQKYRDQKVAIQAMDYDDLLLKLEELLTHFSDVRTDLQGIYQYIMVDEYQDTNRIQASIIKLLAGDRGNVMVVGDDSQSIYSFRGADFKNIMEFPNLFPRTQLIKLEQNYRSTQPILDLTNWLIMSATEKYTKNLFADRVGGDLPVIVDTSDEHTQSRFVSQRILELRESGIALNEIAVLVRSGWHSNDLEIELQARNIPFQKYGGFKFIETAHVKDLLSYIKLIQNPLDMVSWSRVLSLLEGVGPKTILTILEQVPYIRSTVKLPNILHGKRFSDSLNELVQFIFSAAHQSPESRVSDAIAYYTPYFKTKYDDYAKRSADLESVKLIAARYNTIDAFLSEISLDPPDQSQTESLAESSDDEKLTISTIHSAKGLEWKAVFLISAVDGYIPSFQSLGDRRQLEEERRLLYVALTRAKDKLFIVKPNLDGAAGSFHRYPGVTFSKLTRFLDDVAGINTLMERWVLKDAAPRRFGLPARSRPVQAISEDLPDTAVDPNRKKYFF